ncbi:MAG: hypothetical protein N4A49_10400 [Marinifilaceae bacterium]|jgi:hypothetical protein|nr:hypothetical protein [Marinifilaceae bacterium]
MKKIFTSTLALLLCIGAMAQTKPEHKKKMYRSPEGKLYVNKHQPMYLFLGTDPSDKSKAEKLTSESTAKYANPFYFDTEGLNTVRTPSKVDPITKKIVQPVGDVVFEVYADGLNPATYSKFFNAPKYIKNGIVYYGKGLKMTLSSKDKTSGVEKTFISIDGSDYTGYSAEKIFDKEKPYTVKYYALDNVGNDEDEKEKKFQTDLTAPVVNHKFDGEISGKYISGRTKIILTATDNLTGVQKITYSIDGGTENLYNRPISASKILSGEHKIEYWGTDFVKNKSIFDASKIDGGFIVDNTAPKVNHKIIGDQYKAKYTYVSNRSKLELIAEDKQAGVEVINYGFKMNDVKTVYSEPFKFIDKLGLQTVYYNSTDKVKNKSVLKSKTVYLDNATPISGIDYLGPQFFTRDTLFINKLTKVKLFSYDKASGVKNINYKIDENSEVEYNNVFNIEKDGFHKVHFYANDNVNNKEELKNSEVFVDNIGPAIYVNFSIKPIRTENIDGKTLNVYPPYVKMYLGATDKSCGTKKILYKINNGQLKSYSSSNSPSNMEMFKTTKTHKVYIKALDKLGNESIKEVSFIVAEK